MVVNFMLNEQALPFAPSSSAAAQMAKALMDIDVPVVELQVPKEAEQVGNTPCIVAIRNANSPAWDQVKERFFELGFVGANIQNGEKPTWFGTTKLVEENAAALQIANPLIISYYTVGTGYEKCADYFRNSMEKSGLDYALTGIKSYGSWEDNCAYKPIFIRDMWRRLKRPVVWLDVDATIEAYPSFFFRTCADVAFHKWRGVEFSSCNEKFGWELCSGTLFFNQSEEAGLLLNAWCEKCATHPLVWDQMNLDAVWAELSLKMPLKTLFLPQRYLQIFDRAQILNEGSPVIKHWQASRRFKAEVSGGVARKKPYISSDFVSARRYARFF